MNRYVCIHAHFYQPPRENPWLEEVELQDSAYPYHDWNERITTECYAPNTAARILDGEHRIVNIVSNYSRISFNFGPTLLSWMEKYRPSVYKAIIEADKQSRKRFSGHGSAIAQVYNHIIMPLANSRDKRTQIVWGIRDFKSRFARDPEGMWLAETAVDMETLTLLAEAGIKFTILSPHQARRIRKIGDKRWVDVSGGRVDPKMPYLCVLPSGRKISIFFYDGPVSHDVAFGNLLDNGENFANRLIGVFADNDNPQLVHIATDGETYGHHHRYGDMALAYCLYHIESHNLANITVYGEYLEKFPPVYEVEIIENSSWSCVHGIERWRSNCGCNSGMHPGWTQEWRAPLRGAMDWLRDNLSQVYEERMSAYFKDLWGGRDDYIEVILNRTKETEDKFFARHQKRELSSEERVSVLKLLEMQRHTLLMYTSCGWFFDEISGIETVQVLQYVARAIQLAREVGGMDLEPAFMKILERAPSNVPLYKTGDVVYEKLVRPAVLDLLRVGAHYAVSSLFEDYKDEADIYCYRVRREEYERLDSGKQKIAWGCAHITSNITREEGTFSFAVLHLGDHNLMGGVRQYRTKEEFLAMQEEIKEPFIKGDVLDVVHIMDKHFGTHNYSIWHLFRDEQRKVLNQILRSTLEEIESSFRQIVEHHYPVMQVMHEMNIPLPKALATMIEFVFNVDLRKYIESEECDCAQLRKLIDQFKEWSFELDRPRLDFIATRRVTNLMRQWSSSPEDTQLLETLNFMFEILTSLPLDLRLWEAQNIYFSLGRRMYKDMEEKARKGDKKAKRWQEEFLRLGGYLRVKIV